MKPISLHGHERSITQIIYNREGDLLFSSAKDQNPNVWYSINGERLGTYDGHGKDVNLIIQLEISGGIILVVPGPIPIIHTLFLIALICIFATGGAVWCIDVDWETKNFLSGAADNTIRLWDVCTGNTYQ